MNHEYHESWIHLAEAMESISCGTPMLAANAQGFAMYLTHGVNAIQLQSRQQAAFQISIQVQVKSIGLVSWIPETLFTT